LFDRKTDSRGRSAVPVIRLRIDRFRLRRVIVFLLAIEFTSKPVP
jgi:hypothetical protein